MRRTALRISASVIIMLIFLAFIASAAVTMADGIQYQEDVNGNTIWAFTPP